MEVKELRSLTGLSQKAFGEKFGVPLRTIQSWESDSETAKRKAPDYVVKMMARIIELESK